jgi:sarcosine dehydrogenase
MQSACAASCRRPSRPRRVARSYSITALQYGVPGMMMLARGYGRRSWLHSVGRRRLSSASLPASADAIVIGGGSIGASVLYHLAKDHGINAVLLEANQLTSGTTWHSAGLLWQLAGLLGSGDVDLQLSQYTKQLVEETLPAESGEWAGWTMTGSLFACKSEERLIAHNRTRLMAMGIAGVESHALTPQEAKEIHPLMNVDDLVGAIYTPSDGTAWPCFSDAIAQRLC